MVNIQYKKSCTEVLEILKHIPKEDYEKIPTDIINVIENDKEENYHFEYDVNKTLDEQNVSKQAKIMIALFFREYWATEHQKEVILANERLYIEKKEEEKRKKYEIGNIFKNKRENNEQALIEIKHEKWYKKIISFLKNILKKDKK